MADAIELIGSWHDGLSSQPRPVRLWSPAPGMLRLAFVEPGSASAADDGSLDPIPISDIALSPRLGRTPRILVLPGQGCVECQDSPQFDLWFVPSSRVEAAADWLERRRWMALCAAVLVALGSLGFLRSGLPMIARVVAPRIPAAVERNMSQQALALMDRFELQPSTLPEERRAQLQGKFHLLVQGLSRQSDMRLAFRSAPRIGANAFALPDGQLVVTDQLVALARNDGELMAVLAHEAGHHEHRHALRQTLESSGIVVVASVLFGDVSGSSLTVSIPAVMLETGFSRDHEREADAFALALLARRGIPPARLGDILERLEAAEVARHGDGSAAIGYLSTHPPSRERIKASRAYGRRLDSHK